MNNLKQIGLAAHNYHSINDTFPPAVFAYGNGNINLWGQTARLAPHLEQQGLFNSINFSLGVRDPGVDRSSRPMSRRSFARPTSTR